MGTSAFYIYRLDEDVIIAIKDVKGMPLNELFRMMRRLYADALFSVILTNAYLRIFWCNAEAVRRLCFQKDEEGVYQWPEDFPYEYILQTLKTGNAYTYYIKSRQNRKLLFLPLLDQGNLIGCQVLEDSAEISPDDTKPLPAEDMLEAYENRNKLPLTIIFSTLGLLARELRGEKGAMNYLHLIMQNCYRLLRFSEMFSDLVRLRLDQNALHLQNQDLCKFIQTLCKSANALTSEIDIPITCTVPSTLIPVSFDPARLRRAFLNLISNACKYTRPGNHILVKVEQADGVAIVTVADCGAGMDMNAVSDLLQSREHPYRDTPESNGRGFQLVKTVVQKHGGTITVDSCPDEGTTVTVTLPINASGSPPIYLAQERVRYLKNRFSDIYIELSDVCGAPMP